MGFGKEFRKMAEGLLKHEADPNIAGTDGKTPLKVLEDVVAEEEWIRANTKPDENSTKGSKKYVFVKLDEGSDSEWAERKVEEFNRAGTELSDSRFLLTILQELLGIVPEGSVGEMPKVERGTTLFTRKQG
jgi:hypothetical protein